MGLRLWSSGVWSLGFGGFPHIFMHRRVRNNLVALLRKSGAPGSEKKGKYVSGVAGERNAGICHIL